MLYGLRKILYILLILLLFSWLLSYLQIFSIISWLFTISIPLILAFIIRFLFDPIMTAMKDKKRKLLCVLLYAIIMLIFVGGLYLLIPTVIDQCMYLYSHYDWSHIENYIHPSLKPVYDFLVSINVWDYVFSLLSNIGEMVSYWLTTIVLAFGISFYLVYDNFHISQWIEKKQFTYQKQTLALLKQTKEITYAFIKATFLDFLFFFVISVVIFSWIGYDYVYYIATFLALTNLIAYIGPYIGGVPVIIYGFFISIDIGYLSLLAIIILQLVESNFIQPLLFKKCLATSPIASIIAISIFGDFFGIMGMVIAPLLLAYLILIKNMFMVEKKE